MNLVHDHLPGPAQQVYQLMADHPGPDTAATPLAAALELTGTEVADALQMLPTARLLDRSPGDRYQLPGRLHRHAASPRDRERPSIRTRQRARLVDFYAATAAAAIPSPPTPTASAHPQPTKSVLLSTPTNATPAAGSAGNTSSCRHVATTAVGWGWDVQRAATAGPALLAAASGLPDVNERVLANFPAAG
ncbi:hypothetical protein [Amycolatopsis australiensis]|uniref:Uncharacterized protein n=1 Tax=Amycolatopsis australiensis TaxID=546364 RepID=A0A1K1SRH8_9PSEU|nr:hypothetical protein [Amycolatopsis australiensis]SFW86906.1 hypothetical protein SAMN04489730_6533 [Amycolatopsis australiensis]